VDITEVRIKLMDNAQERLQAFCSITLDSCFVIRDLKIIQGTKGDFVAMPSRKLTDRCPRCHSKNHLRANYCNQCGTKLDDERALKDDDGRAKLYADIAHPIKPECRDHIQQVVLAAFEQEKIRAQDPDYVCRYDDFGENDDYAPHFDAPRQTAVPKTESHTASHSVHGKTHRIEPAPQQSNGSNGRPQPPHHADRRAKQTTHAPRAAPAGTDSKDDYEDNFGDGIL